MTQVTNDPTMNLSPNLCDYCHQRPKFPYAELFSQVWRLGLLTERLLYAFLLHLDPIITVAGHVGLVPQWLGIKSSGPPLCARSSCSKMLFIGKISQAYSLAMQPENRISESPVLWKELRQRLDSHTWSDQYWIFACTVAFVLVSESADDTERWSTGAESSRK